MSNHHGDDKDGGNGSRSEKMMALTLLEDIREEGSWIRFWIKDILVRSEIPMEETESHMRQTLTLEKESRMFELSQTVGKGGVRRPSDFESHLTVRPKKGRGLHAVLEMMVDESKHVYVEYSKSYRLNTCDFFPHDREAWVIILEKLRQFRAELHLHLLSLSQKGVTHPLSQIDLHQLRNM